ncbi:MAG: carboxylesterase [Cyanobacteria bacterium RYN_339]|nr:carboxylesterase [Cyanobacteria bacterium RYN_339]
MKLWILGVALFATGCSAVDLLNGLSASNAYDRVRGIDYGPAKLDVYRPKDAKGPTPLVVFFYGGFWVSGRREDYFFAAEALASHGVTVVVPDYRVYPEVRFPTFLQDAAKAVRWAVDHEAHGQGVYLMGHSAGAHIASMLTLDERYLAAERFERTPIKGTVALAGLLDFTAAELPFPPGQASAMFGERWAEGQPISYVDGTEPPMLLLHGEADADVAPKNSEHLAARIRARHGRVTLKTYAGMDHQRIVAALARPTRWLGPVLADVLAFIRNVP